MTETHKTRISKTDRMINILANVSKLGQSLQSMDDIDSLTAKAERILIEHSEPEQVEFDVSGIEIGNGDFWYDGFGYKFLYMHTRETDRLINKAEPGTKIYHSTLVDSRGVVVTLFHVVK